MRVWLSKVKIIGKLKLNDTEVKADILFFVGIKDIKLNLNLIILFLFHFYPFQGTDKFLKKSTTKATSFRCILDDLASDLGFRRRTSVYNPNDQDSIRKAYLQQGACQLANHKFCKLLLMVS